MGQADDQVGLEGQDFGHNILSEFVHANGEGGEGFCRSGWRYSGHGVCLLASGERLGEQRAQPG
jgi:hypothetical protein